MVRGIVQRARAMGFTGPYYAGARGTLRFLRESLLARNEFILSATPDSVRPAAFPAPDLVLHTIQSPDDAEPYRSEFENAYYPGYLERWVRPFAWGESAVIGTVNGELACYNWMQRGTSEGYPTYYRRLFEEEARVLRASVLPRFRGRGLNATMKRVLLDQFFDSGIRRVFSECYEYNTPSIRSLTSVGFEAVGFITVIELWPFRTFVRWRSTDQMRAALTRIGITETA